MSSTQSSPPETTARFHFNCPACGIELSLESHLAGITGPCPICASQITAPSSKTTHPTTITPRTSLGRVKRRIGADSNIDQRHLERREATKTMLILLLFILAFCACLLVTWFMNDWIRR